MSSVYLRFGITQLGLVLALFAGNALANEPARDPVTAQALFDTAKKLVAEGNHAAACPNFEESQRLDPTLGTQLNLALCYEATGRTASAWTLFREVEAVAPREGDAAREQFARMRAEALEPKLSRITINVSGEANVPGLSVERDGVPVGTAQQGIALPIDRGAHVIRATAPGRRAWETSIDIDADGMNIDVQVPLLEQLPPEVAPQPAPTPVPLRAKPKSIEAEPAPASFGTQRVLAIGLGAAGIASYGVATYLGFRARARSDDSERHCTPDDRCNEIGLEARADANRLADAGTFVAIGGSAALAAGIVLWLTAPKRSSKVSLSVEPRGIWVRSTF